MQGIRALLDALVVLTVTLAAVGAVSRSALSGWVASQLGRPFLEYALMAAVPMAATLVRRRGLAASGLSVSGRPLQLRVALTCMVPYAVAHAAMGLIRPAGPGSAALIEALVAAIALLYIAAALRNQPCGPHVGSLALATVPWWPVPASAISALLFYGLFLGPAEEILFRGYIQSRLNEAFPRRWQLKGVACGWGLIVAAAAFSLFHVLNLAHLFAGSIELLWWRGLPTFLWGLFFGYIREKAGSVFAPALVHGIPQGLAWAYLGR